MVASSYALAYPRVEDSIVETSADRREIVNSKVNETIRKVLGTFKRFIYADKSLQGKVKDEKFNEELKSLNKIISTNNAFASIFDSEIIEKDFLTTAHISYRSSLNDLMEEKSHFEDLTHFDPMRVYMICIAANVEKDSFIFNDPSLSEKDRSLMLENFDEKKAIYKNMISQFVREGGNFAYVRFIATLQKKLYKKSMIYRNADQMQTDVLNILDGMLEDVSIFNSPYKDLFLSATTNVSGQTNIDLKKLIKEDLQGYDLEMIKNVANSLINIQVFNSAIKDNSIPDNFVSGGDDASKIICNFTSPDVAIDYANTTAEVKGLKNVADLATSLIAERTAATLN